MVERQILLHKPARGSSEEAGDMGVFSGGQTRMNTRQSEGALDVAGKGRESEG
jgi:hypothetical protein